MKISFKISIITIVALAFLMSFFSQTALATVSSEFGGAKVAPKTTLLKHTTSQECVNGAYSVKQNILNKARKILNEEIRKSYQTGDIALLKTARANYRLMVGGANAQYLITIKFCKS